MPRPLLVKYFAILLTLNYYSNVIGRLSLAMAGTNPILSSTDDEYKYTVIIDPSNDKAEDSKICHPPNTGGTSKFPCLSLKYAFEQFHQFNSVKFYLTSLKSKYDLNATVNFTDTDKIGIFGNDNLSTEIECNPHTGLSFLNTNNIEFSSVTFSRCGAEQKSTSKDLNNRNASRMLSINVGLYFYNCTNVKMYQVQVKNSSHATGVVMYDVDGRVEVNRCNFTNNRATSGDKCEPLYYGGGGFSLEFTYCQPGDDKCLTDESYHLEGNRRNRNATYVFLNSNFSNNFACGQNITDYGRWSLSSRSWHQAVGRGGGLSFFLKGDARNNTISFVNCSFFHNHAVWGGGLLFASSDSAVNNTVVVAGCSFVHNHAFFEAQIGTGGGGIFISTNIYFWSNAPRDEEHLVGQILLDRCNFTLNEALQGGAISFELARHRQCCPVQVSISNSVFQRNKAQLGTAVSAKRVPDIRDGHDSHIIFHNCSFANNIIKYHNESLHPVGIGTVYVNQIPVDFCNTVNFTNNSGSAMGVVGTQVSFAGVTAHFADNTGLIGAGIALLGTASIVVDNTTSMNFTNNHASQHGGAIYNNYIIMEDLRSDTDCFIHYSQPFIHPQAWNASFLFLNNKANTLGNAIFSSSVLPCSYGNSKPSDIFCWKNWKYGSDSNCSEEIYTRPHDFSVRGASSIKSMIVRTYPGIRFQLPLTALDDLHHNVTGDSVYFAYIHNTSKSTLRVQQPFQHVSNNYIGISGSPRENATLALQTIFPQIMHVNLTVSMQECPPGFFETNQTNAMNVVEVVCNCSEQKTFGNAVKCFSNEMRSYIQVDKWLGVLSENDKELYMGTLPMQYRKASKDDYKQLPLNRNELDKILCGGVNRNKQFCGECVPGYAVSVNSPDYRCVPCNLTTTDFVRNLLAYSTLTYGPILVLFLAIIFLNFKLTSSAAMGFVLYAQMIGSEVFSLTPGALMYNPHFNRTYLAYSTIYGIFNLNSLAFLMDPFCLNKDFNTLDVIGLDYAIAAFPLAMIITIYFVIQCTSRFKCPKRRRTLVNITSDIVSSASTGSNVIEESKRTPRNSLIHAFSAFLFLSYTKFCLASMKTMAMKEVYRANETYTERRIALAGQWKFTDDEFLHPYGMMAIFVFIFAVLLPPFLLLGPVQLIDWLIEKRRFRFLVKIWPALMLHTFLDTFQGFYRPGRRFFGGIFVLFRLVAFISYSFAENINQHYAIQQVAVSVLICLLAIFRPYTNELHNQVNILIFLNLSILNTFAIFMYADSTIHFSTKTYTIQCVLVWLPLIYIICYAVWRRVNQRESYLKIKDKIKNKIKMVSPISPTAEHESRNLLQESDSIPVDEDEDMFQRATRKNRYRPPSRSQGAGGPTNVTYSEVPGPSRTQVKLTDNQSTNDSGAGTGTGTSTGVAVTGTGGSSGIDVKYTD